MGIKVYSRPKEAQLTHFWPMPLCYIPQNIKDLWVSDAFHCVKNVQIRSFFWSVFSCIWNDHGDLVRNFRIQSKCEPEKTSYLDNLCSVFIGYKIEALVSDSIHNYIQSYTFPFCTPSTYSWQKFPGFSWMVKRYYSQDYPEYSGSVLTG